MAKFLGTLLLCSRLGYVLVPLFLVTTLSPRDIIFALHGLNRAQESSTFTYHSRVSEVHLVFFATDEHNRTVDVLQRDDFAVIDNGRVIRNFRSFTRSNSTKLDVVLLIDSSESALPRFDEEISEVLELISQWPQGPGDDVSIIAFSGLEVRPVCAGNCRSWFTGERAAAFPAGGATPLYDAIVAATNFLEQRRQPDVLPVIILFSDGDDTISKASFNDALQKMLASEEQIYTVEVGHSGQQPQGRAILQKIAEESGGRCLTLDGGAAQILDDVIDDLHSAHVVTYELPQSYNEFHTIRILPTRHLNWQFRCRRGYNSRPGGRP